MAQSENLNSHSTHYTESQPRSQITKCLFHSAVMLQRSTTPVSGINGYRSHVITALWRLRCRFGLARHLPSGDSGAIGALIS